MAHQMFVKLNSRLRKMSLYLLSIFVIFGEEFYGREATDTISKTRELIQENYLSHINIVKVTIQVPPRSKRRNNGNIRKCRKNRQECWVVIF